MRKIGRMDGRSALRSAAAAMGALLICMVIMNFARSEELAEARTKINAVYQKAFYEICELTEGISSNYRKLLVAGDEMQTQMLLGEIRRQTQGAAADLALLPLGEETISATIKYINQAEDFAKSLSTKIASGDEASEDERRTMEALSDSAAEFSLGMNRLLERFENGEGIFDAADFQPTGDETLYPLANEAGEYPALLYDGPFSDGATIGDFEYVKFQSEITQAEAEAKLRSFLPVEELRFTGESRPEVEVYEFQITSGGYSISAGVTKLGGEILYLLPENTEVEVRLSEAQLTDMAQKFLISRGYGAMEMSYYSSFGGVMTINYAAVQDGTILYSDLVKVQLSMADGQVIGLDARGYLRNHRRRDLAEAVISQEEAIQLAGERLTATSARRCLIPQNGREYLCYELKATDGDGDFLVYIDAQSGVERELMQIISDERGTLVS